MLIDDLPEEMLCAVMRQMPPRWVGLAALVSSRWCRCAMTVTQETRRAWPKMRTTRLLWVHYVLVGKKFMDGAACDGHTSAVVWLHDQLRIPWRRGTLRKAALAGHKHTVATMLARRNEVSVDESCLVAALIGGRGLAIARLVHRTGQPWTPMARAAAVALGDPSVVAALNEQCGPRNADNFDVALAVACRRRDLLRAMQATGTEIVHAKRLLQRGAEWGRMPLAHQSVIDYAIRDKLRERGLALRILAHVTVKRRKTRNSDLFDLPWMGRSFWLHNDLHDFERLSPVWRETIDWDLPAPPKPAHAPEVVQCIQRKGRDDQRRAYRGKMMPPPPRRRGRPLGSRHRH